MLEKNSRSNKRALLLTVLILTGLCQIGSAVSSVSLSQQTSEESYDNQLPGFGIGCLAFGLCSATFMMLRKKNV